MDINSKPRKVLVQMEMHPDHHKKRYVISLCPNVAQVDYSSGLQLEALLCSNYLLDKPMEIFAT